MNFDVATIFEFIKTQGLAITFAIAALVYMHYQLAEFEVKYNDCNEEVKELLRENTIIIEKNTSVIERFLKENK